MAAALLRISWGAQSLFFSGKPAVLHRAIHTSVWWDMNSVRAPEGCDFSSVASNITDALAKLNYSGPVTLSVYADHYLLEKEDIDALSSTGIKFTDVGILRNHPIVSSKYILQDICFWTNDHPAPTNCLFITGDRDLSFTFQQLRMKGYNIFLGTPKKLPREMEVAAKTVWRLRSLLAGHLPERTN